MIRMIQCKNCKKIPYCDIYREMEYKDEWNLPNGEDWDCRWFL